MLTSTSGLFKCLVKFLFVGIFICSIVYCSLTSVLLFGNIFKEQPSFPISSEDLEELQSAGFGHLDHFSDDSNKAAKLATAGRIPDSRSGGVSKKQDISNEIVGDDHIDNSAFGYGYVTGKDESSDNDDDDNGDGVQERAEDEDENGIKEKEDTEEVDDDEDESVFESSDKEKEDDRDGNEKNEEDKNKNLKVDEREEDDEEDEHLEREKDENEDEKAEDKEHVPYFTKPPGDVIQKRRFPQAVIIGFPKCGTRWLLNFLSIHPYIVAHHLEMHFYDRYFQRGYNWYLNQMPLSWSNQITLEKTPAYSRTPLARTEMKRRFPNIKLIVLVRNPIQRLLSQEAQIASYTPEVRTSVTDSFLTTNHSGIDAAKYAVSQSMYVTVLEPWFRTFPRENILVINGDQLTRSPLTVLKRIERFLHIPSLFSARNVVFNKETGYYCLKGFYLTSEIKCKPKEHSSVHKTLSKSHKQMLFNFFKPYNEKLFKMINQTFDWSMPSD